jgi:hypothetical protein
MSKKIQHKEVNPCLLKEQLHSYQKRAVDFIIEKHNVALLLDMG